MAVSIKHGGFRLGKGDASNPTLCLVLPEGGLFTSHALHVCEASDANTDWNVSADTHPSVYIHSATTPATEYIKMYSDATDAHINAVGTGLDIDVPTDATIALQVNDTDMVTCTSSAVTAAAVDLIVANGYGAIIGGSSQQTISDGDGSTNAIPELQVLGTAQVDATALIGYWSTTNTVGPMLAFLKSGNAAIGSKTTVADNEYLGRIVAFADDGTDYESPAAEIRFVVNGTPGTGQMPGSIEFYTTAAAGETLTVALTIDADQNMYIGNGNGIVVGYTAQETISDGGGATDVIPEVQILGTTQADSTLAVGMFSATDAAAPMIALVKGGNAAIGSHTAVADNEYVGRIVAFGDDGTDLETPVAEVRFVVDDSGGPGASAIGGSLEFYTTADGGTTLTKALTLTCAQVANFLGAVNIATSGSKLDYAEGTPCFTLYATNDGTDGATNAEPFFVSSTLTGAGQVGGRSKFLMTHNVTLGGWANALKAQVDCNTNGGASGLLSGICSEVNFPASASKGNTQVMELEAVFPASGFTTSAAHYTSFIGCNMSGTTCTQFDSYGLLFDIEGMTPAATKFISATSQTAKCQIGANTRYLVFSQAEDSLKLAGTGGSATAKVITTSGYTINNANLTDGYGAVEADLTLTGTSAGHNAALSAWVNMNTGTHGGGGNFIAAQTNGIYEAAGATITGANIIFGMRMDCICADTDAAGYFPFSIVNNANTTTALFQANAISDVGYVSDAGTTNSKTGAVPLFKTSAGTTYYVWIYSGTGT